MSFAQLRRQYTLGGLHRNSMHEDPIEQFKLWLKEALDNCPGDWFEPYAMTVATADRTGAVSARIMLLRAVDKRGFVFYTNYDSAKGLQLKDNPQAALVFYWPHLERQVRIHGPVSLAERELSEVYFRSRPRGSQLGAVVSQQSAEITSREELEHKVAELERHLAGGQVPLPEHWGGYRVSPAEIEFWQGRENRLHDRLVYCRREDAWVVRRLSP